MHLLAELFVGDDDWGFLKEGIKNYLTTPMSPLEKICLVLAPDHKTENSESKAF
jgi:hypothetical protein